MLKSLPEQEIFRIEMEIQALPGDSRCPSERWIRSVKEECLSKVIKSPGT
jgi:hypothetical protein